MLFAEQVTRNYTLNQGLRLYETLRFRHKITMYHKIVQENTPTYLKEHLPPLFSSTNPTIDDDHSNDRYQNTRLRLTGNHFSHRQLHRGIIYRKTYSEQNQLVKLNTLQKWHKSPPFFYNGSRKAQITHCEHRLGISDLNYDLLNRHLTTNSSCDCGKRKETSEHYILHCPRFTHVRQNTIFRLPANLLNITTLLQGDPNTSNNRNSLIFKAVLDFIAQIWSFCYGMTNSAKTLLA